MNLEKREGMRLRAFLMGDGVQCAISRQMTLEGKYDI